MEKSLSSRNSLQFDHCYHQWKQKFERPQVDDGALSDGTVR